MCGTCQIVRREVATLGAPDGIGAFAGQPRLVRRQSDGTIWVLGAGMPIAFDSLGEPLRLLGTSGPGPGEFQAVADVLPLGGDSLLIVDSGANRAVVLGPGTDSAGSGFELVASWFDGRVGEWPSELIMNGLISNPERVGYPLHTLRVGVEGIEVIASYGRNDGELRPFDVDALMTRLTRVSEGTFWSASFTTYDLAHWTLDGELLRRIERRPRWFAGRSERPFGTPDEAPTPSIAAVELDDDQLLWVFISVAADEWATAWPEGVWRSGEIPQGSVRQDLLFDTIVEVIDPEAQRVVARERFPAHIISSLGRNRAVEYVVNDDDVPMLRVIELRLHGSS